MQSHLLILNIGDNVACHIKFVGFCASGSRPIPWELVKYFGKHVYKMNGEAVY